MSDLFYDTPERNPEICVINGVKEVLPGTFRDNTKLKIVYGRRVERVPVTAFSFTPKRPTIIALVFPNVSLSSVNNQNLKFDLASQKKAQVDVTEENAQQLYDYAIKAKLKQAADFLETLLPEDDLRLPAEVTMSLAEASKIFELQMKKTGYKIKSYHGTQTTVRIPDVIGRTEVSLVDPYAFPADTVVHCKEPLFRRLRGTVQGTTIAAWLKGLEEFTTAEIKGMKSCLTQDGDALAAALIKDASMYDTLVFLLTESEIVLRNFEGLLDLAQDQPMLRAAILEYSNKHNLNLDAGL